MLQAGATWLAGQLAANASVPVTYRRGSSTVNVDASLGSQLLRVSDGKGGTKVERTERDFLINSAELVLGGLLVLPRRGDQVDVSLPDGTLETFEVAAPRGEAEWRWCDGFHTRLRIHAKRLNPAKT